MGQILKTQEPENDLTLVTVVDAVTAAQVLVQIKSFLTGTPTRRVLWDLTRGSLAGISGQELQMIVEQTAPLAESRRGGRTAVACARDVDFGMSRMFQTFASLYHVPFEIAVYRDLGAALAWLNDGDAQTADEDREGG